MGVILLYNTVSIHNNVWQCDFQWRGLDESRIDLTIFYKLFMYKLWTSITIPVFDTSH